MLIAGTKDVKLVISEKRLVSLFIFQSGKRHLSNVCHAINEHMVENK